MTSSNFIVPIERPEQINNISTESIRIYQRAIHSVLPLLEEFAIEPFESGLKKMSGYSDDNIPAEGTEKTIKIESIKFNVVSMPTTKRPEYALVYKQIIEYTNHLIEEHKRLGRIKDITLINELPYVSLDLIIEKIRLMIENAKIGKSGVTQKIEVDERSYSEQILNTPSFALDITKINEPSQPGSARIYLMAKSIKEDYEKIKKKFEEMIKNRTGFSKENPPDERKDIIMTDVPGYAILVKVIPASTLSFTKIINYLVHETATEKNTEKTGLLIKARNGILEPEVEQIITEKGDKKFISLNGFSDLLQKLKQENITKTVRFQITITTLP